MSAVRFIILAVVLALASAFGPARMQSVRTNTMTMSNNIQKTLGVAAMGFLLSAPVMPAMADGAASISNVYRARNNYGQKILGMEDAASRGDVEAFKEKKIVNAFDLFISASNRRNGVKDKALKKQELAIEAKLYEAVKTGDKAGLKKAYDEFVKVADLKSNYKPGELGQTDGSGYSPTWGTDRQYIYQR